MKEPPRHRRILAFSLVKPSREAEEAIERIEAELALGGLRSSATLVTDLVTLVFDGSRSITSDSRRREPHHVRRRLDTAAKILRKQYGTSNGDRESATIRFLASWFASAPEPAEPKADLVELDLAAATGVDSADPWCVWRQVQERAFHEEAGGSPDFWRAMTELAASMPLGFGTVAERIWLQSSPAESSARTVEVTSSRRGGADGEPIRSPIGVFREMAADGLPQDPTRIAASDLALVGSSNGGARALLGVKLADSTLMVRFGSTRRPSRRRPKALLVLVLADTIDMHRQFAGTVVPAIDDLRRSFLRAIVVSLRAFESTDVDLEVEIQREGPVADGRIRLPEVRQRNGRILHEFRRPDRLLHWLALKSLWLLVDCPSAAPTAGIALRGDKDSDFDARYLISVGVDSSHKGVFPWTGTLTLHWDRQKPATLTPRATGAFSPSTIPELKLHEPEAIGKAIASILGRRPIDPAAGGGTATYPDTVVFT
jgi:hypothetical protein